MEKEITNKCESIMEEMGLSALDDKRKQEIMDKMVGLVCDRIILKLMGRISDVEVDEANEIMTSEDEDRQLEFLRIKMPDFNEILDEEINAVKAEILKDL
ncbi:MAG TPA: DUF5663 domain-containing protein [Candidatus Pacearchaeota archaeon]|jgi:hypothetical protein|nr:DUF5663 domain-containing protein [Candidatus Pacearchaeota archaeon]